MAMSLTRVGVAILIFFMIIAIGGVIYSNLEGWKFVDAAYFSAVTITTLGYGDFVPQTQIGKFFTIIFSMSGIALGLYILSMVGKSLFELEFHKREKIISLKKNRKFNVEKLNIGLVISYNHGNKHLSEGVINEVGLNYIKMHVEKKNGQLVPKKDQKTLTITSEGKIKKQ